MEVDLRCLHAFVAEPECDDGGVHALGEQGHGARVPQDVRRGVLVADRWAAVRGRSGVFGDEALHGSGADPAAAAAIAKQAHKDGSTLREAALASGAVTDEDYDRWVDPAAMTGPDPA